MYVMQVFLICMQTNLQNICIYVVINSFIQKKELDHCKCSFLYYGMHERFITRPKVSTEG